MEEKLHEREKTHFKVVVGVFLVIILGFSFYSSTTLFNTQPQATEFTIEDIDFLLQAAKQLYISGDYQGAIDMYAEILLLEPNHKYASRRTAQTYLYWYKYDQAEEWLLKTIDAHPDDASLLTGLGKLYRNMDRHDDAEAAFLKSLELDPQLDTTYSYGLGYLYLKEDRYEEAEAMFKKALELNPTSDFNLMAMGDLYREIDEYQLSEEMFKEALVQNPDSEALFGLGLLYEKQHRYEEAAETYLLFFERIREKGEIYHALARVYFHDDKILLAEEAVQRAIELNPENLMFYDTQKKIQNSQL